MFTDKGRQWPCACEAVTRVVFVCPSDRAWPRPTTALDSATVVHHLVRFVSVHAHTARTVSSIHRLLNTVTHAYARLPPQTSRYVQYSFTATQVGTLNGRWWISTPFGCLVKSEIFYPPVYPERKKGKKGNIEKLPKGRLPLMVTVNEFAWFIKISNLGLQCVVIEQFWWPMFKCVNLRELQLYTCRNLIRDLRTVLRVEIGLCQYFYLYGFYSF